MSLYDGFYALFGSFWFWYGAFCLTAGAAIAAMGLALDWAIRSVRLAVVDRRERRRVS